VIQDQPLTHGQTVGPTPPEPGEVLDLDARHAQVREAKGEGIRIRFGGRDFLAPVELPVTFAFYMTQMDVDKAAYALFGQDDGEAFLALAPTVPDLEAIVRHYGVPMGEASGPLPFSRGFPAR
jgi:hypothetical protein